MRCPACQFGRTRTVQRFGADAAAQHFVATERDPERNARLRAHLVDLWGGDHVEVVACERCGFGFAVPFVGGDETFYALAHAGDPHYPSDRWEFGETLAVLAAVDRPLRLAEIGAGHGAFLDRLAALRHPAEIVAADFDAGAVATLRAKGYEALLGSLADVRPIGPFDIVCMFQTVEHMADVDALFDQLRATLAPGGAAFVSMPHGDATELQERLTGYWDMPPNHVGRWTPDALRRAAERHGFSAATALQPVRLRETTWQLAVSSVNARAYAPRTLAARINGLGSRPLRGVLKRLAATAAVPRLALRRGQYRPLSFWAQLRRRD